MTTDINTSFTSSFETNQNNADIAAQSQSQSDAERVSSDYEDFLLLMTTQMQNQDPLKPIDSTEFVSQLAEFSGVEQQVNMNKKLDDLLVTFNNGQFDEAALYLGKAVNASTGKFTVENGKSQDISYLSPNTATSANVNIYNDIGDLIHSVEAPVGAGEQSFTWNGKNSQNGQVADGVYKAEVVFNDFSGNEVSKQVASTKNIVSEVIKTETGFDLKTRAGDILSLNDVTHLSEAIF